MLDSRYPDKNKKTILVVDDSDIERKRVKEIFGDEYNVLEAQNGRQALGIVKSNYGMLAHLSYGEGPALPSEYGKIQLIILDIVMPVMDGHEFLRQLKNEKKLKDIPVVVATTLDSQELDEQCLNEGAMDIVKKPYNPSIVLTRVRNILSFKDNIKAVSLLKYDALTGFKNRNEYYEDVAKIECNDELSKKPVGIVFADVNGLKKVNDRKGHLAGDALLKKVASNIKVVFGDEYAYRLGGDEFVAFSFDNDEDTFNNKLSVLNELWTKNASASVGSVWLKKAVNIERNISLADKRMYINKNEYYGKSLPNKSTPDEVLKDVYEAVELIPGGFAIYHAEGNQELITINNELVDILGYSTTDKCIDAVANSFAKIVYRNDADVLAMDIQRQIDAEKKLAYCEHRVVCSDGSIKKVSDYIRLVHLERYGDVYISFINDIQREFDYGEQGLIKLLDEAKNAANMANEAKSQFLYNMSHDIRTMMNSVVGYTQLALKNENRPALVMDYLRKIDFAESNLMALISNILELSSIESNRIVINNTPMYIAPAIDKIKVFIAEQCKSRSISLKTYMDVKHDYFYQDQDKNGEITVNIISNAIKYTPKGGTISFGLRELPGEKPDELIIEFTCSDTGVGMSKEFLEKAFDSFERERSLTSTWQGSGLGLAIVKKLVERMGGRVEIISEIGKGTTVKTFTPHKICTKEEYDAYMNTQRTDDVDIKGKYILVVDDNDLNLDITAEILRDNGVIAETAHNGREACQILLDKGPGYFDAVIMDIQMPVMDGIEATKVIRKFDNVELANIPVIAITAHAFDSNEETALKAGMNGYISKPIKVSQMLAVLGKVISR